MAPDVVLPDPEARRRPVDVPPAQGEQLALAEAGHRRRHVHGAIRWAQDLIIRDRPEQGLHFLDREEPNVLVLLDLGTVHLLDRVAIAPSLPSTELEDLEEERQRV